MDINEQTDAFCYEVGNVVRRFRDEFDLNHATIVGVLEMIKMEYYYLEQMLVENQHL